ncbi:MAG: hypothetical protein HY661_19365 [Betaproteobacteria bacterium]|nr:hypothetical protein [Betaproteobacteria bacterium]
MAEFLRYIDSPTFEYAQQPWGDLIYGTREEIQSIGIGVGMAFPGEPGGKMHRVNVVDPRGFPAEIENAQFWKGRGIYAVCIRFPGREREQAPSTQFAPGVKRRDWGCHDEYVGTADALVSAGIVNAGHFPGMPGMRKVKVTVLPDGSLPQGAPSANCSEAKKPGTKYVERASRTTYRVCVRVSEEEDRRRSDESSRAEREWEARMRALPRPAPLVDLPEVIEPSAGAPKAPGYRAEGNVIFLHNKNGRRDTATNLAGDKATSEGTAAPSDVIVLATRRQNHEQ